MALLEGSIFSQALQMNTGISVILPHDLCEAPREGFPVLYLLHGLTDNHSAWVRNTNITYFAEKRGLAVVMPEVQRSYYTNMKHGLDYFTYVSEELPALCRRMFGFSKRREDTFAAGISMGGYGALKCGLRRPDVFSACAGISGAVDIAHRVEDYKNRPTMRNVFGDPARLDGSDDLFALARTAAALPKEKRPRLFLCCGTGDSMLAENRSLRQALAGCGLEPDYAEDPGGHDWDYWESMLPRVLDFFMTPVL